MLILFVTLAHADAVGPPPEECPAGAIGTSSHEGPRCIPNPCAGGTCDVGACESTGLCVFEEERPCGGLSSGEPCTYTYVEATGTCETDADCTGPSTCVTDEYCVDPASSESGSTCGCSSRAGASVVLLGLLPLLGARRRPR